MIAYIMSEYTHIATNIVLKGRLYYWPKFFSAVNMAVCVSDLQYSVFFYHISLHKFG